MQEGSVPTYQDRVPLFPGGSCYPLSGDTGATGTDERVDQLSVIFSVIGMPSEEDLKSVGKVRLFIVVQVLLLHFDARSKISSRLHLIRLMNILRLLRGGQGEG